MHDVEEEFLGLFQVPIGFLYFPVILVDKSEIDVDTKRPEFVNFFKDVFANLNSDKKYFYHFAAFEQRQRSL